MAFLTAEQIYNPWGELDGVRGSMLAALKFWSRLDILPFDPEEGGVGQPAVVVANHGRWVVQCPSYGCNGAQVPSAVDPWFFCDTCLNAKWEYKLVPLVWPRYDPTPQEIVEALIIRKDESNRNWFPGERYSDLVRQNDEHRYERHEVPKFIRDSMQFGFPMAWAIPRARQVELLKKAGLNIPPDLACADPSPGDGYTPTITRNYGGSDGVDCT